MYNQVSCLSNHLAGVAFAIAVVLAATGAELGVSNVAVLAAFAVEEGVLGAGEVVGLLGRLKGLVDLVAVVAFELLV